MKNIFSTEISEEVIGRINKLTADTVPKWGKMNVGQMLAHLNVVYEKVYDPNHPKPGKIKKLLLKIFVKNLVVNEKPYRKNSPTAPEFKIVDERDFNSEKERLVNYIRKTEELGRDHFHNTDYPSFGILTGNEWNNLFYKHIDHHLTQFGV